MPLKIKEIEGVKYAEVDKDGNPLYVDKDGKEMGYDGETLASNLLEATNESATLKTEIKDVKESLSKFDGIDDPEKAKIALQTVANLDDKKLIDAGEVERVKKEAVTVAEEKHNDIIERQYKPIIAERDDLRNQLHNEMIGGRFARSKFIDESVAVPGELIQSYFGKHFSIEDNKVVAKGHDGKEIVSKDPSRGGVYADFDEALQILVESSPMKDSLLKGNGRAGTGSGRAGSGEGDGKSITREQANKMAIEDPAAMAKLMSEGISVVD